MEARKLKEGEAAMAAGAKCKKTSLLGRWKPDWEGASSEYEKAATAFRVGKAIHQAIGMYQKASEAQGEREAKEGVREQLSVQLGRGHQMGTALMSASQQREAMRRAQEEGRPRGWFGG